MKFYFPDSQDQIDPEFDFVTEVRPPMRLRQRDDRYAHEYLEPPPYEGLLVSKAMIDGNGRAGRYSAQQRQRFYREGVRDFFRLDKAAGPRIETLGDCGAFGYIDEQLPPFSTDQVIDFYEQARFDAGVSVDHVIPVFEEEVDPAWRDRYTLTLELAEEFIARHRERRCRFEAVGVAQGWDEASYAGAVARLQDLGYERIAIGGLVPLKTNEILRVLEAIDQIRRPGTRLHLFGVTRCEEAPRFVGHGVTSFDSTSPFRRAFKDGTDNYHVHGKAYVALRVPQVEGNAKLQRRIGAGIIDQAEARKLEQEALAALRAYDQGEEDFEDALQKLCDYQDLHDEGHARHEQYRRTLADAPWRECECNVCSNAGIEVVLFRGSERNKRRGFHNLHVFAERLAKELQRDDTERSPDTELAAA